METMLLVLKILFTGIAMFGFLRIPIADGGNFAPSAETTPGDPDAFLQIRAVDGGTDIWNPTKQHGGYRYGPSMILRTDGSLDAWFAANGPGDLVDVINYKRLYDGGKSTSKEIVALKPTPESHDERWTCDPGVVKIGDYYYIGYTTTKDERGVDNDVCIARCKSPAGPFLEKWTGSGWGVRPAPLIEYTGNSECFGAGEPSFVLMGSTLYIYYSWCDENGASTRVATADVTDENWPAHLTHHGECIPPKDSGDSTDVKYVDAYGRFVAVFTEKRFSGESYVAVWESFDGIHFRQSGFVKENTAKMLHNCGISGRADGHIGAGDPVYLGYAYGSDWGNWPTRLHAVTLSLADAPMTDKTLENNADVPVVRKSDKIIPDIIMVKAEKQVYTIEKSCHIWTMAMDSDGFVFPVLWGGVRFEGYDKSVIRIVGSRIYPVGAGTTRVTLRWCGLSGDFVVHVPNK